MPDNISSDFIPSSSAALASLLKLQTDIESPPVGEGMIEDFLYERYLRAGSGALQFYYRVKPLIPRKIQIALRRSYSRVQGKNRFPDWPIEPILVNAIDRYLITLLEMTGRKNLYRIAPWPKGTRAAFTITHDVEWDKGLRNAQSLAEIEKQYGFRSSWNIVPERYPIDWSTVETLRSDGFEIGVHDLHHDGSLFRSEKDFNRNVVAVNRYIKEWGASGFRSGSTLRNTDWMQKLDALYDSSFSDTDPYEPKSGGCCSIWPYFIGDLIELPITMPQDHTLFEILQKKDISIWKEKASWVAEKGGCIMIDVHPDYMQSKERLLLYESFLQFMKGISGIWHTLPRQVATWWRDRRDSNLQHDHTTWSVVGPAAGHAAIMITSLDTGKITNQFL